MDALKLFWTSLWKYFWREMEKTHMAKAQPLLQHFLARGQGLLSPEDFGQAFCNTTASCQKALWCFELLGHLLLSSHSDTPENYSANLISYCWVPVEIQSGPCHQNVLHLDNERALFISSTPSGSWLSRRAVKSRKFTWSYFGCIWHCLQAGVAFTSLLPLVFGWAPE